MSNDLEEGFSWILVDPRVTSRGESSSPECLTLSVRLLPDFGATNEIKTLAFLQILSASECTSLIPASEKIYVEEGSNLISFANVFKSLLVERLNRRSWWTAGIVASRYRSHPW